MFDCIYMNIEIMTANISPLLRYVFYWIKKGEWVSYKLKR